MEKVDTVIIGGGIIGLAVAECLSRRPGDILLLEKESSFGQHSSSRNSEVIHSGIYYVKDSLKAQLCVQGNASLYAFLEVQDIPHKKCGKLVIASDAGQMGQLEALFCRGKENGVEGLDILPAEEVYRMEPLFRAHAALWVPSTGLMDTHLLMKVLESRAKKRGVLMVHDHEVIGIRKEKIGYRVYIAPGDFQIRAKTVVNAAGLWSDRVCAMAGIDPDSAGYRLHWNRGEYYKTSRYRDINHLVYPLPDPDGVHLGIHTVSNLSGELSFGPSSRYVKDIDYRMDENLHQFFCESISQYLDVDYDDIRPDMCGIRPKLQGPGDLERDFVIADEEPNGYPGLINLIGIESPGLTCCLSIAELVDQLVA